jgi:hypothetical protein
MIRRLLISLALLAAVLVAADFGVRLYSQSVVGDEVKAALKLSEKPHVTLGGWPFLTHLISGDLSSATFTAATFSAQGVRLRRVTLTLDTVKFPSGRLLFGGGGVIHAKRGHGTAALSAADVNAALHRAGAPFTVSIAGGRASVSSNGLKVGLSVKLEGNELVLSPAAVGAVSARFPLPKIVRGLRYTSVKLEGSEAVLTVALRNAVFVVPGSG